MPAYISHAIMGQEVYNEGKKEKIFNHIPIDIEEIKGYSLGIDFSYLSKTINYDPHNYNTKAFFIYMLKYIKDNKLENNTHIISLLYGHIAHYFFDLNTHPLIYYMESNTKQVGPISNHNLIEGYLSSYLSKKILKKDIMQIKSNYFNQINLFDPEIIRLLNNIYGQIYQEYNIIKSYRKTLILFSLLEKIIKLGIIPKKELIYISRFNNFLEQNNITINELTNEFNDTYTNPVTGEKHNESFLELYYKSITMSLETIYEINKYLYADTSINLIEKQFKNLSYNTGVSCSLGNKMVYVRKKIKK